ncbi:MAG: phospholipase D-like domain-containing protein [Candidatus Woesearchaeota archaeon]
MHHKFFIIDNGTVITGSFNPSKSADQSNDENIIIIEDPNLVERFRQEFQSLK